MSLYLVVHHKDDSHKPWANDWQDADLIKAITTTQEIGKLCGNAAVVFIHRCAWSSSPAVICCEAQVENVTAIDSKTCYVSFKNVVRKKNAAPPLQPAPGQNSYLASAV